MKKSISIILALTLITGLLGMSVSAADLTPVSPNASTTITANIEVDYVVTIPASTTIPYGAITTNIGAVQATKFLTEAGSTLTVTANCGESKLVSGTVAANTSKILYTCSFTSQVISDTEAAYPVNINITQADWDAARAGNYSSTINFAIVYTPFNATQ